MMPFTRAIDAQLHPLPHTPSPSPNNSKRSFHMDPIAAKYIGAGIACIGMGGAGVGVGTIFGHYLAAALRNPSAAQGQFGNLIFGFAVTEALGIVSPRRLRRPPWRRKKRRLSKRWNTFRRRSTAAASRRSRRTPSPPSWSG